MIVLNIPGWKNSGEGHWQTIWEANDPDYFRRIQQKEWMFPKMEEWIIPIKEEIARHANEILVTAHSIGCMAFIHAVHAFQLKVKGALLVAPSDPERQDYPTEISGFGPVPLFKLPFPSVLVVSTNDQAVSVERARFFAQHWNSKLVVIDSAGHIDQKTGHGPWEDGKNLLKTLY